jgi:ankyrin repeat protein
MFASTKEIAELLLARGARLDARNQRGDTLLIVGSAELVEYFLDKGVDPRQVSSDGWSALTVAARRGRADLVKRLLAKGVPVDLVIKPEGWSALHFAAYNRDAAVVALLVQAGANVRLAATRGETAFVAAFSTDSVPMTVYDQYVKGDSRPVATILLDKGAAIDATDDHGRSALMYAARRGDADAVRFLVERGADAKLADDEGKRALDFAREGQATAVVTVLQPLTPAAAAAQAPTAGGPRWPYLSEREITQAELDALSREDLVIARNEVYARHGYSFKRPELAAYFAKQPWYKVDPAYDEKSLTDLERKNIRLLLAAEKARK